MLSGSNLPDYTVLQPRKQPSWQIHPNKKNRIMYQIKELNSASNQGTSEHASIAYTAMACLCAHNWPLARHTYLVWFWFGNRGSKGAVDSSCGTSFLEAMTAREGIAVKLSLQTRTFKTSDLLLYLHRPTAVVLTLLYSIHICKRCNVLHSINYCCQLIFYHHTDKSTWCGFTFAPLYNFMAWCFMLGKKLPLTNIFTN